MDEFELIDDILKVLGQAASAAHVLLGPGDDCAVIRVPSGQLLVSSIDALVADVHFPAAASPELIAYRAMAVNLSDLAAMGATPAYGLMALTLPEADRPWVENFARGVARICTEYECPLVGGNIAQGPLNITVSIHGFCESNFLQRNGARPGDFVAVTGLLGAAGQALVHPELAAQLSIDELMGLTPSDIRYPLRRYYLPQPRITVGKSLRGIASAAIDLSDGLAADLEHICSTSAVGAELVADKIPLSPGCSLESVLGGCDDYELCVTIPATHWKRASDTVHALGLELYQIGRITSDNSSATGSGNKLTLKSAEGVQEIAAGGYQHFNR